MVTTGCGATTITGPQPREFVGPGMGMLNKGIHHSDVDVDRATKRLGEVKQFPDTQDIVLQELRAAALFRMKLQRHY